MSATQKQLQKPEDEQDETLDAKQEFKKIRKTYQEDPKTNTFNALICGEMGTGKTHILKTARKPVLYHAFDPGGEKTLKEEIEKGEVLPETFIDNPLQPYAFNQWVGRMKELIKKDMFKHFGTYSIDSSTMWAEAILNYFVAKRAPGSVPEGYVDYMPQKNQIRNWIGTILSFPCDVIVTGHLEETKDEVTGRVTYRYATTGKGTILIPAQFDEVYVSLADETSKGIDYKIQTAGAGRYAARSRLAQGGKLEQYEEPNIKNILRKTGYPIEDKPIL